MEIPEVKQNIEAAKAVFQNPLLLDMILEFVHYGSKNKLQSGTDVAATRRVARGWLQSTTRILKKSRPILDMFLRDDGKTNKLNGNSSAQNCRELLNNFVSTFSSEMRLENSILPLHLDLHETFFRKENCESLRKCFEQCGDSLSSLTLSYRANESFEASQFDVLPIPNLLSICFNLDDVQPRKLSRTQLVAPLSCNGLLFLQLVLNGATSLKRFEYTIDKEEGSALEGIDSIRLPPTVTELSSFNSIFTWDYRLLIKNTLPNLEVLRLDTLCVPHTEHFFDVLDRFKNSLKVLKINKHCEVYTDKISFLRFPCMETMEYIFIRGENYQIDWDSKTSLSNCFPKLRKLTIELQTESYWTKWIKNSRFENVCELGMLLINEDDSDENGVSTPSFGFMHRLQNAFPNVLKFRCNLNFNNVAVLKVIFQEWKQLIELELSFDGEVSVNSTPNLLGSTFLGISTRKVDELTKTLASVMDKNKSGDIELNFDCESKDSIFNLKELTLMKLEIVQNSPDGVFTGLEDLLNIVLMKLPNFKELYFLCEYETYKDEELDEEEYVDLDEEDDESDEDDDESEEDDDESSDDE